MTNGKSPIPNDNLYSPRWQRSLAEAVRDPETLIRLLNLPEQFIEPARRAATLFPLLVPRSYLQRMQPGNAHDPLLRQVLPLSEEFVVEQGDSADPVGDSASRKAPGLLQKYQGRALLISTGACAVHCRYCFRRHYPYGDDPRRLDDWTPAFQKLTEDTSISEVILSGGDPLMLTDHRLGELISRLGSIPHLTRLRIHSRLPIVLPDRVTEILLRLLQSTRLQVIMVVHANHPRELVGDCSQALQMLVRTGIPTLNQAVLLRGVNDDLDVLEFLCRRCVDLGVMPYYLHQLDRVSGAGHFEVSVETGRQLLGQLRSRLPGYAVPRYVAEIAGRPAKSPIEFA